MTTLLQDAADWLGDRLQDEASRAITYERSPSKKYTITGVPRERMFRSTNKDTGIHTQVKHTDWIVLSVDIADIEPRRGDKITDAAGRVFEVHPIADMPCWEYEDMANVMVVLHTKKVA